MLNTFFSKKLKIELLVSELNEGISPIPVTSLSAH